jgi:hypothetical protein
MKDEHDNKTGDLLKPGMTNAERQAAFRERQRAAGKRQAVVWIDDKAWQAGFAAGEAGRPGLPVGAGMDGLSWLSGWIEGDAKRQGYEYSTGAKK